MTNGAQRSIERRDDFPKLPEIDFTDSNLTERISSWNNRAKNELRKPNESLCQKIDIYLSHLKNKGEGIIKSGDWIENEEFHYLADCKYSQMWKHLMTTISGSTLKLILPPTLQVFFIQLAGRYH